MKCLKIKKIEIATKFLEYYWFQECKYKFKQDFNKDKVPVIIGIIQKYCGTEYISDSYENYFKERQELQQKMISEIEKRSLNNVIPRFQPQEQNDYYLSLGHTFTKMSFRVLFLLVVGAILSKVMLCLLKRV